MAENTSGGAAGGLGDGNAVVGRVTATEVAKTTATPGGSAVKKAGGGASKLGGLGKFNPTGKGDVETPKAEPQLGAGGTSVVAAADELDQADVQRGSDAGKIAKGAALLPVAGAGGQVMVLLMFLNWLKGMLAAIAAMIMNLVNLVLMVGLLTLKALFPGVFAIGSFVSAAVGGTVSAVTAGIATVTTGAMVAGVIVVSVVSSVTGGHALAQKDSGIQQCSVSANASLANVDDSGQAGSTDAQQQANAKLIYSVLAGWGMPDENIAGILGNMQAESSIDPTSVQGDFDSPQAISDAKKSEAQDTNNGIGLGQWTFGRNTNLRAYAAGHGLDWWDIKTQLGFLVSSDEGTNAAVVKGMITKSQGTPAEAAYYFHDQWERSADDPVEKSRRATYATTWMGLLGGWTADKSLADSILAQAGTTVTGANAARADAVRSECISAKTTSVVAAPGGMTLDQATALMADYKVNGKAFLDARYAGGAGPGACGPPPGDKSDNCVGFDTYFMNKFTSFQQYAPGNGVDQAASIAQITGKKTSKTPTVYSVGSGPSPTGNSAGHVYVVLGIQGDNAVIGEAACGTQQAGTRAYLRPLSEITDGDWTFVDVSDLMLKTPMTS